MKLEMDCNELVELTTAYFEGALAPDDAARLEAHLTECDGCGEFLRQMRVTQHALGRVDARLLPADGRDRLLNVFREWKRSEPAPEG